MLHWNESEQNRLIQEQRRGGNFDEDSGGDDASIGSEDEGEVGWEDDSASHHSHGLARHFGRSSAGTRPAGRGALARGGRTHLNARLQKPTPKGPQMRDVVSDELQKALRDISQQLKSSSPVPPPSRLAAELLTRPFSAIEDGGEQSSSPDARQSTPPTESKSPRPGSAGSRRSAQKGEADATATVSANVSSWSQAPKSAGVDDEDEIADFEEEPAWPQQQASQRRAEEPSQAFPSQAETVSQRSQRGVKSWFGRVGKGAGKAGKAAPRHTGGSKRAAAHAPELKSPTKVQRGGRGARGFEPRPPCSQQAHSEEQRRQRGDAEQRAAAPASWGGLRAKLARERKGRPAAEDDISDFSDNDARGTPRSPHHPAGPVLPPPAAASPAFAPTASQPRRIFSQDKPASPHLSAVDARPHLLSQEAQNASSPRLPDPSGGGLRKSFLKNLKGADFPAQPELQSRGRGKRRGALSKKLERALQQQEKGVMQFKQGLQADGALLDKLKVSQGAGLTVFIVGEQFEAHLYVCLALAMGSGGVRERICVVWPGGTRKNLGLSVGAAVHIFPPWSIHCISAAGIPVLLGSELCAVLGGGASVQPDSTQLNSVDLVIPQRLREELARVRERQASLPSIWQLPKAEVSATQATGSSSRVSKIASLAPWQANVSVKATILRSCPRSILIAHGSLDDDALRERFSWMEVVAASAEFQQTASLEPHLWIGDDSGVMCKLCTQSQVTEHWRDLFVGGGGRTVELSGLSLRLASTTDKLGRDRTSPDKDAVWKSMPVSKYELVATTRSRKVICPPPAGSPLQPDAARYAPVSLASLFTERSHGERKRVSVLVELLRMHPLPSDGRDGTPYQTWMCVRDPSLKEHSRQNVLVVIADLNQMLACADVLAQGDVLLMKDVLVTSNVSTGEADPSGGVTLTVDTLSLVTCAVPVGRGSDHGVNGACGMVLPVTEVDAEQLHSVKASDTGAGCFKHAGCAPLDGWVTVRGAVLDVSDLRVRKLCPVCRGECLTCLDDDEDEVAAGQVLICDDCEEVMMSPLVVYSPCVTIIEAANESKIEIWLRGSLVDQLLGPPRDDGTDWEAQLQRLMIGRQFEGECAVIVNEQTEQAGPGSTCWAVNARTSLAAARRMKTKRPLVNLGQEASNTPLAAVEATVQGSVSAGSAARRWG